MTGRSGRAYAAGTGCQGFAGHINVHPRRIPGKVLQEDRASLRTGGAGVADVGDAAINNSAVVIQRQWPDQFLCHLPCQTQRVTDFRLVGEDRRIGSAQSGVFCTRQCCYIGNRARIVMVTCIPDSICQNQPSLSVSTGHLDGCTIACSQYIAWQDCLTGYSIL